MKYYLLILEGDAHPRLTGPYPSAESRDQVARQHKYERCDKDGLYRLDLDTDLDVKPSVDTFPVAFFKPVWDRIYKEIDSGNTLASL